MKSAIRRLQDWYLGNCDGDWEHSYGISIETLDNPGWTIKIDLHDTDAEGLQLAKEFQNPLDQNDWFFFKIEDQSVVIACGPGNLEQALTMVLDEIAKETKERK